MNSLQPQQVSVDILDAVSNGYYHNPHDVLGPHSDGTNLTIRVIRQLADSVTIVLDHEEVQAKHEYNGIWVAVVEGPEVRDYRVRAVYGEVVTLTDDGYRYLPTVGEMDRYLFSEGRHERLWEVMGSHIRHYETTMGPSSGVSFAVWAPNAKAVRVVGDFNGWNGTISAMRTMGSSGVWELFIPGAEAGAHYKYEIQFADGSWHQKADPFARQTEVPPSTASIVTE